MSDDKVVVTPSLEALVVGWVVLVARFLQLAVEVDDVLTTRDRAVKGQTGGRSCRGNGLMSSIKWLTKSKKGYFFDGRYGNTAI